MAELKIMSEAVLEAAKQCPAADRVLRTLFPKAFDSYIKPNVPIPQIIYTIPGLGSYHIEQRSSGSLAGHLYLPKVYDYEFKVKVDNEGADVLVLHKKVV